MCTLLILLVDCTLINPFASDMFGYTDIVLLSEISIVHDVGHAWFYSPVSPTSVNSLSSLDATLYPNPASSHLTLSLEDSEMASLNIYDSRGYNIMTTVSSSGELIDITILNSGLYFYEITQANKSMAGKFIKY